MTRINSPLHEPSARLSLWLLSVFLVILCIAGGASRADVSGQAVVRFFAWSFLAVFVLFSPRFDWHRIKYLAIFMGLVILLVGLQLVPLPPVLWTALPGRELLIGAAEVIGETQPWRPLSISPSATANALGSLIVPVTVLVLCANLSRRQHWRIAQLLLGLVLLSCIVALLQFSGSQFDNPFVNYQRGMVSGNFANRNHLALFAAIGCVFVPVWGFGGGRQTKWKALAAVAVLPFFLLVILATGSRAGLVLGCLAVVAGFISVRDAAVQVLRTFPRWAVIAAIGSFVAVLSGVLALSFALGRAAGLDRVINLQTGDDLRSQALPNIFSAIEIYFPAGSGFGTFDPVYRIGEPDALLQPLYLNHAHNDWLEIVLDGGLPALILLSVALYWFALASLRAWRTRREKRDLARPASATLFIIMLASLPDYPARTPLIMAIVVLGFVWLSAAPAQARSSSAAPKRTPR